MEIVGLDDGGVGQQLAAFLARNGVVALVADRDLTGRGVEVEMFGATRRVPAGPALLSISTGAPLVVVSVYETRDGWRCVMSAPIEVKASGNRRADITAAHPPDGGGVRARDRLLAARLAHVPARLARVRIALVCPYAWDDPGGVQVARSRARRAPAGARP